MMLTLQNQLKECTDSVFTEECVKWMQDCCNIEENDHDYVLLRLKFLQNLVTTSTKFPVLGKPICNSVVSRFTDVFIKKLTSYEEAWRTLETLLWHYNGPFVTSKEALTNVMMTRMNGAEKINMAEAKFYALLPSAGGGGAKGTIHKANWKLKFDYLVDNCHDILNLLFKDVREIQIYNVKNDITRDAIMVDELLVHLHNHCLVLQAMCLGRYPVVKNLVPEEVLDLIHRGVSISGSAIGDKDLATTAVLKSVAPEIHINLMKVLSSLLVSCGRALLPFNTIIVRTLKQCLQTASTSEARLVCYASISNWLLVAKSGSGLDGIANILVIQLLSDIQPTLPAIVLRDTSKNSYEAYRKRIIDLEDCEPICYAALQTLKLYLNTIGFLLQPNLHKDIQEAVVRQLLALQSRSANREAIYSKSERCRQGLYDALVHLCLEPSPRWPPPTQFASYLLRIGANDGSPLVAATCSAAFSTLDRIIHPEFRVAAFPIDYECSPQENSESSNFFNLAILDEVNENSRNGAPGLLEESQSNANVMATVKNVIQIKISNTDKSATATPINETSLSFSVSEKFQNTSLQEPTSTEHIFETITTPPRKTDVEICISDDRLKEIPPLKNNLHCSEEDLIMESSDSVTTFYGETKLEQLNSDSSSDSVTIIQSYENQKPKLRKEDETVQNNSSNPAILTLLEIEECSPEENAAEESPTSSLKRKEIIKNLEMYSSDEKPNAVCREEIQMESNDSNISPKGTPRQPSRKRRISPVMEIDENMYVDLTDTNFSQEPSSPRSGKADTGVDQNKGLLSEKSGSPEKKYNLRSKILKEDVDSPMILRSGSLLPVPSPSNGFERRPRRRAGSVSSQGSQCSRRQGPGSPRSELGDPDGDLIQVFDDCLPSD